MSEWSPEFQKELLAAENLSAALALFCPQEEKVITWSFPKPMSYSEISRRMGLRSRSHVREIILGAKPTPKNFLMLFCRVMKMGGAWIVYFELLKKLQDEDSASVKIELEMLRQKLTKSFERKEIRGHTQGAAQALFDPDIPIVYASLGDMERGATVMEVSRRSMLSDERILECLKKLLDTGAIEQRGTRYLATNPHLIFAQLGEEKYFQIDFIRALEKARVQVKKANPARCALSMA